MTQTLAETLQKMSREKLLKVFEELEPRVIGEEDKPVVEVLRETWLLAEKMAGDGHEKTGFPSIYDSIYHAIAIKLNTVPTYD